MVSCHTSDCMFHWQGTTFGSKLAILVKGLHNGSSKATIDKACLWCKVCNRRQGFMRGNPHTPAISWEICGSAGSGGLLGHPQCTAMLQSIQHYHYPLLAIGWSILVVTPGAQPIMASTLMGMNERMWLSTSRASSCLHGMHLTQRQENGQPTILINSKMDKSYLIGPPLCGFMMNPPFMHMISTKNDGFIVMRSPHPNRRGKGCH